ncbi:TolC family protein [bacterium]|nr:TolC family protein [bacterium]
MKQIVTITGALLLTLSGLRAQDSLTLEKAVSAALLRNPNVAVARNDARIAGNTASAGKAGLMPRLSISGGADYQDSELLGAATTTSAGASLSYTLFDGFGTVYDMKAARSAGKIGYLSARADIENTIMAVSDAYYGAASSFETLNIAKEALVISRERLRRAEERSSYGRAGAVDVLAARVDVNTDSVTVVEARLVWEQSSRTLNLLLGRELAYAFTVDTDVAYRELAALPDLISRAREQNVLYLITQEQTKQAKYSAGSAAANLWPQIDLTGSLGYSRSDPDVSVGFDNLNKTVRGGISISWTLFNGGRLRLARESAVLEHENRALLETYAENNLETQVVNAYEAYRNSRLVLDLEKENLEAAELNFQRTRDLYQLGQVTSTQFREAQLNLVRSRTRLQTYKFTAKLDELSLLQLTGILITPADLDL